MPLVAAIQRHKQRHEANSGVPLNNETPPNAADSNVTDAAAVDADDATDDVTASTDVTADTANTSDAAATAATGTTTGACRYAAASAADTVPAPAHCDRPLLVTNPPPQHVQPLLHSRCVRKEAGGMWQRH